MDAFEQVLGEDASSSTMLSRFIKLSSARCPSFELDLSDCELEALRYLGRGEDATCGTCKRSDCAGIVPESCPTQNELPSNLWDNTECELFHLCRCRSSSASSSPSLIL